MFKSSGITLRSVLKILIIFRFIFPVLCVEMKRKIQLSYALRRGSSLSRSEAVLCPKAKRSYILYRILMLYKRYFFKTFKCGKKVRKSIVVLII